MDADQNPSVLTRCPELPRHLWTADDYHRMAEVGLLDPDSRVELIEGEIVEMAPIGDGHADASNRLNRLLVMAIGERGIVAVGNPVRLNPHNEPQPDFTVLRLRDGYNTKGPRPEDVLLCIEVSDTTLRRDREVKRALYARAGIPEFWIVNVGAREIEIHRSPVDGTYQSTECHGLGGTVTIQALPDISIQVSHIFG